MTYTAGQNLRGYLIRDFVQEGGFSTVYKAHQDSIFRDVAIKIIENDHIVKNIDFIRRFEVEAQIIARLEHPHIVPIYDFWREPDSAFIVMRWLDGGSIRSLFNPSGYLDAKTVSKLLTQIGSALHFVHQRGIVHRDIKPDNILIDDAGNFYLTDFGIAIDMQHYADVELEFLRIGTPEYMSPEQILYDTVTFKSDIYAFAILVYEILTLQTPFTGDNMDAILVKQVNTPFPSVYNLRHDLPHELDLVLDKATRKSADERYDSILEFVEDLLPLISDSSASPSVSHVSPASATTPVETLAFSKVPTETRVLERGVSETRNPYKGLKAFDEADAGDFYGRDAVIQQMIVLLHKQLQQEQPSFLAVIGASGSGKSSVVRAGLMPRLRYGELDGSDHWLYIMMTPGESPITTFAEKLNSIAVHGHDNFVDELQNVTADTLRKVGNMVGREHIFLLIDQFEEVFIQVEEEAERSRFIDLLLKLSYSDLPVTIVVTLRADFYDKPLAYRELGELIQPSTITVLPMSSDELERVIMEPAESVNCVVQPSLVSQLIADTVHQPNALPLLQFTITELFENREDDELTLNAYETMGRLQGSVAQRAETVFKSLSEREQLIAQRLFLQLVILLDTNETVRRRILWRDAVQLDNRADVEAVINVFGENRLLTFDREPTSREPTIEVAHEALIQAWTRLQIWIAENRNALMMYNRLTVSVHDWLDNDRDNSFLARDVQLVQYEGILDNPVIHLTRDEQQYVQNSQALRRRNQILRYAVITSLVLLTLASVVVTLVAIDRQRQADISRQVALEERDRANTEAEISRSRALAATALNSRENGRTALLLAVEANTIADTFESQDSLINILDDHRAVTKYYSQNIPIRDFVVSSDMRWVYSVGDSNEVLRLDLNTAKSEAFAEFNAVNILNTIAISSDDSWLAVGGEGGFSVIDSRGGEMLHEVNREGEVWSLVWSRTDRVVYGVDSLGAVFAFDRETGEILFDVSVSSQGLFGMALHPNKDMLAVGGIDNVIYVLDTASNEVIYEFEGHSNWILTLAFSPDGSLLATSGADLNLIVWDMEALQALGQIPTRHTDWIRQLAFSGNGSQMLTASADSTIKRWDVATGRQIGETLARHLGAVWAAAFVDEDRLLSVDRNGELLDWRWADIYFPMVDLIQLNTQIVAVDEVEGLGQVAIVTNENDESSSLLMMDLLDDETELELALPSFVTSIDYSPSGNLLAIAGVDQMIRLVDVSNPDEYITLGAHDSIVLDVDFTPDGSVLTSVDDQGMLLRWDIPSRSIIDETRLSNSSSLSLVRYLTDEVLLTADRTGAMSVWDARTLEEIATLTDGHDGAVTDVLVSNDGETLYSVGRDGLIIAWDVPTWGLETMFSRVHTDWILDIAQVDSMTLATTGRDGALILWDVERRQQIGVPFLPVTSDWGLKILLDDTSKTAFTLYRDGQIVKWELSVQDWLDHACAIVNVDIIPGSIQHLVQNSHYCISQAS